MLNSSTEGFFFRKPQKSVSGLVLWCGDTQRQNQHLQFHRSSQRNEKISLKEFGKKKTCVKKIIPLSESQPMHNKQKPQFVIPESHSTVTFSYPEPKVLQVQKVPNKPFSSCSEYDKKTQRVVKPFEEIKKARPFLSFASPSNLNLNLTFQKSETALSATKPTSRTKPQDQGRSEAFTEVQMRHSIITANQTSHEAVSTQQIPKEQEKRQENLKEKMERYSDEEDEKEANDTIEAEEVVQGKNAHQGTLFGLRSPSEFIGGGLNKLQRNKYETRKLFSKIRKIQTMLSQDDGQPQEWSKVSQVLENFQGLLSKFKGNNPQDYTSDMIIPK